MLAICSCPCINGGVPKEAFGSWFQTDLAWGVVTIWRVHQQMEGSFSPILCACVCITLPLPPGSIFVLSFKWINQKEDKSATSFIKIRPNPTLLFLTYNEVLQACKYSWILPFVFRLSSNPFGQVRKAPR